MSENAELMQLYSNRILALAADMPHTDRLTGDCVTIKRRAPLCGSTITIDVVIENEDVVAFGQEVKACALGQASASVIGAAVVGASRETITNGRMQLAEMLKNNGPVPDAPFAGLEVLKPAQDYRNRHASILLSFDALSEAFDGA